MLANKSLFPFPTLRPQQEEVIEKLNQVDPSKKYIFLECGTGTGKSGIAVDVAKSAGPAYVLTTTKQLQDQYGRDFEKESFAIIKGKQNYPCTFTDGNCTCDVAPCVALPQMVGKCGDECVYFKKRERAKKSQIMCANYAYFFRWCDCGNWDDKRPLLIFDEAHNLEAQLISFAEISFNPLSFLDKYYAQDEVNDEILELVAHWPDEANMRDWLLQCYEKIIKPKHEAFESEIEEFAKKIADNTKDRNAMAHLLQLKDKMYLLDKLCKKCQYLERSAKDNWTFERIENEKSAAITIKATPIEAGNVFHDFLAPKADRFIFMSATLLNLNAFANAIGLNPDECAMIKLDSPFPPENAPVMSLNLLDLKYKPTGFDKETKQQMIETIKQIVDAYPDKKGIIHTGNSRITEIIMRAFHGNPRFLCRMDTVSNTDIMEEHIASPLPTILVSSSLMDGADLYDDLSRFQIIVKMPFLSLGDKRISLKTKRYPNWYLTQTWMRLIQACGRSVRSETDQADTYILDKAFAWQYQQALNARILPRSFVKRVKCK